MTQVLSGVAIAAVLAACWVLRRPRPQLLRSTDATQVAALNRSQMERVLAAAAEASPPSSNDGGLAPGPALPAAADGRSRQALLRALEQQFQAGGLQRRQAMATCRSWGHRAALPLLHRGLRDPDPQVVALAAEAIAAFRGRPKAGPAAPQGSASSRRLPRNVARTR